MATARDMVKRAMRARKVLSGGEEPTADELADGLDALNAMLFTWPITEGVHLQHVELSAGDTLDVPDDHIQTIALSLAERLTDYGGQMDPMDVVAADQGRTALRAMYFTVRDLSFEAPLYRDNLSRNRDGY